jgi:tRNA threonylcarbamoyladenosine biosynthesis protein TsaB
MGHPAPGPGQEARPVWILALDASLARCSAALLADGEVRAHRMLDGGRGHAATLPPMVQAVLREAGVAATDLDAVAAVVGPGGFTGIRAALALAQGLALAAGLPALGVTTGEALVAGLAGRQGAVWSVVDTRRGRVVLERFAAGAATAEGPPEACDIEALPLPGFPITLVGDAAEAVAAALSARGATVVAGESRQPDAAAAARVAALRLAGRIPPLAARPLYVEPPAVRLPA